MSDNEALAARMRLLTANFLEGDGFLRRLAHSALPTLSPRAALYFSLLAFAAATWCFSTGRMALGFLLLFATFIPAGSGELRHHRLLRLFERVVDFLVPLLIGRTILDSADGLLAVGGAIAALFLYHFSAISYVLVIPRPSVLAEELHALNRAFLERGGALPFDRGALLFLLAALALALPPSSALPLFALLAFLLWAAQSIRLWRRLDA